MTTNTLIQKQREIIQRSYRVMNDYEQAKANADAHFKREKETAEAAGREISNATVEEIRKIAKSTEDSIKTAKLQSKVSGGSAGSLPLATSERELLLQISQCQSVAVQASKKINEFRAQEMSRANDKGYYRFVNGTIAFGIGCLALILLYLLLPQYLNAVTFIIVFVLATMLSYRLVSRLRRPKYQDFDVKNDYATLMQMLPASESIHKQLLLLAQQKSQNMLNECQIRYAATMKEVNRKIAYDWNTLQLASIALVRDAGIRGMAWSDPAWQQWPPSRTTNVMAITRLGTLTTGLHKELPTSPAFIACPGEENILFKAAGSGKNAATTAIQSIMLRLLSTQSAGKVRFTLIDPVGLGQNVAIFMQLADYDEKLVTSRAWTESRHIEQQLTALSEHMENVIQKYLRGQYKTIEEYNAQAGEVAEPYRVLVVMGFPVNFSEEAARRLVNIATNGPRCGVSTIIMMDTEQPLPYSFNLDDLARAATVFNWEGQRFVWQDKDFKKCELTLDTPPSLDLFNQLLKKIGEGARDASDVKVPFERIAPPREEWWKGSTREGLKVPLGRAGATKLQYLDLGKGTAQHALVVGKTGSGKTTLLHLLITNLALFYSPDELELYLVDFKTVGFTPYAAHALPHARVVAIQSEREFGLSVLQRLDVELERRKNIFSKAGVQDIAQYRGSQSGARMPRILLLVDEFQEFFTYDDKVAQEATLLLDRLVRQGRAFGMHVMLGSQTLAGAYTLARTTIGQMAVRIALQCEESDSRLVLSDDNPAARLLSRPGEAIYNAANGLVEGNNPFQCSWLSDEELDTYLDHIQEFSRQHPYEVAWKQVIFDGSKNADPAENVLLADMLRNPGWNVPQKAVQAWVGDPIAIKEPTSVQIRSQAGCNLLIVGQQEEAGLGMIVTSLLSLTAQHAPGTARFYVIDFTPSDATYAELLSNTGQILPHGLKVVNRRGLPSVMTEIADELQDRLEADSGAKKSPVYLFIYGLQRARDLRPDEDFSYSSFGSEEPKALSPAKQFSTILREGPEVGIHTLVWCDTLNNLNRTLERGLLREFELRIVFQMSQEDSLQLVDSPAANKLGPYRALLFDEEAGQVEKFRPYGLPAKTWLEQAATDIRRKK